MLTVYRDRRPYPHRLLNAIEAYGLGGKVRNSHRALDDVYATLAVMEAMDAEKQDLVEYVDLFGYIPKFGCPGQAHRLRDLSAPDRRQAPVRRRRNCPCLTKKPTALGPIGL